MGHSLYNLGEVTIGLAKIQTPQLNKQLVSATADNLPQNFPPMPDSAGMEQGINPELAREMLLQEGIVLPPDMPQDSPQTDNTISNMPDSQAEIDFVAEMEAHAQLVKEMEATGDWPPKPAENQSVELPPDDWMETNRLVEEQMTAHKLGF